MRLKHINQIILSMLGMFLLLSSVVAQSVIFSPDQWPKRWERAMHHQPMNGHLVSDIKKNNNFKRVSYREQNHKGWGRQRDDNRYTRSRTPEYNYQMYNGFQRAPINDGSYLLNRSVPGYYGNAIPIYPNIYQGMYPNMYGDNYSGIYPGANSGLGMPGYGMPGLGLGYPTPIFMAPGIYPGGAYPW